MAAPDPKKELPPRAKLLKLISPDGPESFGLVRDPGRVPWTVVRLSPEGDETDEKVDWRVISTLRLRDHPEPLHVVFESVDVAKSWLRERAPVPAIGWDALLAPASEDTPSRSWNDARGEHDRFVAWAHDAALDPSSMEAWERAHQEGGPLRHSLRLFDRINCQKSTESQGFRVVPPGTPPLDLKGFQPRSCNWEGTAKLLDAGDNRLWTAHGDYYCPHGGSNCCVQALPTAATRAAKAYTD